MKSKNSKSSINWERTRYYIYHGFLGIAIIFLFYFFKLLTFEEIKNSYNFNRLLWCLGFVCLGFSFYGLQFRRYDDRGIKWSESVYNFITLLLVSLLIFSFCHLHDKSSLYVFYYLSAATSFISGYLSDRFWEWMKARLWIPSTPKKE